SAAESGKIRAPSEGGAMSATEVTAPAPQAPPPPAPQPAPRRRWKIIAGVIVGAIVLIALLSWIIDSLGTVSTDDAYISGHVTFVAARIPGQVTRVLVDDNN